MRLIERDKYKQWLSRNEMATVFLSAINMWAAAVGRRKSAGAVASSGEDPPTGGRRSL